MFLLGMLKLITVFAFDSGIRLSIKTVDNTSSPFYGRSILTSHFASCTSGPYFLSSSLQLIACSLMFVSHVFVSEPTFLQQKFVYEVGIVSSYSAQYYSTFSPTSNLR